MKKTLSLLLLAASLVTACKKTNSTKPSTPTITTMVSTLAGTGFKGNNNGVGNQATFNQPLAIAADAAGNVYVADWGNNLIRKITPAGLVSTLLDVTNYGGSPTAIAVDASGNIYFTVTEYNTFIYEISPAGIVSPLAGTNSQGNDNGPGNQASFNLSWGRIAVDAIDNVYVADMGNNLIRKITTAGNTLNYSTDEVTTLAGTGLYGKNNGPGNQATFYQPRGIAVDAAGNVFVSDQDGGLIRKITPAGVVSTFATGGGGIAVDTAGNVYLVRSGDLGGDIICRISTSGVITTLAGSGAAGYVNGLGSQASFNGIGGLAIDASGNIYVADTGNNLIRKIVVQ